MSAPDLDVNLDLELNRALDSCGAMTHCDSVGLTDDEKRAAVGYGPKGEASSPAQKFNPHHDHLGRFTNAPDGEGGGGLVHPAQSPGRNRAGQNRNVQREGYLTDITNRSQRAVDRTRELDPTWRPPSSTWSTREGEIAHREAVLQAAEARYGDLTRDAVPGANPSWGVNRLTSELYDNGYQLVRPTDAPGLYYRNPRTGEEIRIMERPLGEPTRTDPLQKYYFDFYYRYRPNFDQRWGNHVPIPNK